MATTARPGRTVPNTAGPAGVTVHPCGSCSASLTPCRVWLPPADSVTRTTDAWPACTTLGEVTTTWRAPGVDVIRNALRSGRFASAEESPT